MVFSNFFFAGRNLARGLWRKASSMCHRALFGFSWLKEKFSDFVKKALEIFSRPEVIGVSTFVVILKILLSLGFTSGGIAPYSAAAAFQSVAYAAFTPAGGPFASLTSMAMTGVYPLFALSFSAVVAIVVAIVVKEMGKGPSQTQ